VRKKTPLSELPGFSKALAAAERVLGSQGRVLVRYSGTEPILRFLVEGEDAKQNADLLKSLQSVASSELT